MPTGVHLVDPRESLFDAAERVLRRDGVGGLTSRAVTAEAGVAKGVLHRHFPNFDAFLAELIADRVRRLDEPAARLRDAAGSSRVVENLAAALAAVFSPLALAEVALVVTRDALRARLQELGAPRFPLLARGTALVADYLTAEQDRGRIDPAADIATLSPTVIGAVHLLLTDHENGAPDAGSLPRTVSTLLSGVLTTDRPGSIRR